MEQIEAITESIGKNKSWTDRSADQMARRFRALVENSNDAFVLRDKDFSVIYCSPASERMLGWTEEERRRECAEQIVHQDDLQRMIELKQYVLENPGHPVQMTYRILHKNGNYRWSEGVMTNWLNDENVNAIVSSVRDITERKRIEEQVAESERRYRILFQQNLSGVFQTAATGEILNCNQAFASMLGYSSPKEIMQQNAASLYFADIFRDKFINVLREQKRIHNHEVMLKKKDGSPLFVIENISLFTDSVTGEEICDGVLIDITEKKKSEEANMLINNRIYEQQRVLLELGSLKMNMDFEEKLKTIVRATSQTLDATRVSIWTYSTDKKLISSSYVFNSSTGFLPGISLNKGDHPGYFETLASYSEGVSIERMTDAIDPSLFIEGVHLSGVTSILYIPIRKAENVVGFVCHEYTGVKRNWLNTDNIFTRSVADIISMAMSAEDIRIAKAALNRSEERYRQIVETAQEGIWLIDENNQTVFVNKKMCEMLGYSEQEMIGRQNYFFKSEDERQKAIEQIERRKLGISETHDTSYIKKDGGVFHASVSSNPILLADGSYAGALAMVTDITKRKEDEALLQQSEAKLARKNEELEIKNKELEQFVYIASHDLQEPLRTIAGFAQLLQQQYKGTADDRTTKYFDFILQGSDRMKTLIKDLLDYSRIGKKGTREVVDCIKLVNDVTADLGSAISEANAEINFAGLPEINGYPTEIKQLFQNLIINAVKFRKPGVVPVVDISAEEMSDCWQFAVKDNGIGIDRKNSERVFVIFQRLHTRTEYEGSGIGLAHCKKIVELHGGKIWIESELGEGTTFNFTIQK